MPQPICPICVDKNNTDRQKQKLENIWAEQMLISYFSFQRNVYISVVTQLHICIEKCVFFSSFFTFKPLFLYQFHYIACMIEIFSFICFADDADAVGVAGDAVCNSRPQVLFCVCMSVCLFVNSHSHSAICLMFAHIEFNWYYLQLPSYLPINTTLYFPCFVYLLLFPSFSFIYINHTENIIYYMFVYQKEQQQLQLTKFQSIKDLSIFYNLYALVTLCNTHSYNFVL